MNILTNYEELKKLTGYSFQNERVSKRIIGILFARPNPFTKDEILSGIDYFNNRSGKIINFFCAGYQPSEYNEKLDVVAKVDNENWSFDSKIFNKIRQETEQFSKWKYSGSVELVLFNAIKNNEQVELDFSDAICIDLMKSKNQNLITSTGELFEEIFRLSENLDESNPSKNLSLKLIGDTAKNSFIPILIKLLPKQIQKHSQKIYMFGTENRKN